MRVTEVELGHKFVTVYGDDFRGILELGQSFYTIMPKYLKETNDYSMAHRAGDPMIFHPFGNPDVLGREHFRHFHVIFDHMVGDKEEQLVRDLIDIPNSVPTTNVIDTIPEGIDRYKLWDRSKKLLELRKEYKDKTTDSLLYFLEGTPYVIT